MKPYITIEPDFDSNIEDVILVIFEDNVARTIWINGFDDKDWKLARQYASNLSKTLNIEFIDASKHVLEMINHVES